MRRVGKLMYEWMGFDHLPGLLEQLAQEEESGVPVEDRIRWGAASHICCRRWFVVHACCHCIVSNRTGVV